MKLSRHMHAALVYATETGVLCKSAGGYWTPDGWRRRHWAGTQTVQALVDRGLFKDVSATNYLSRVQLTDAGREALAVLSEDSAEIIRPTFGGT